MFLFPRSHWKARNCRRVLSVASFPFLSFVPPKLAHVQQPAPVTISSEDSWWVWLGAAEDIPLRRPRHGPVRDTALPHLPPHLGTSPCKPVATWVPPPAAPTAGNLFVVAFIRRSLNSRSFVFFFIEYPNLHFCLPQICQHTHTLFIYYSLACILFPKMDQPARAIASSAHISYCSGTKVFLFLSIEMAPAVLLFQAEAARSFPDHCPQLMISLGERLGEEGIGIPWWTIHLPGCLDSSLG